jgi:hypothetical protein
MTSQWTLGDLACEVEKSYGEDKLGEFAEDIGVPFRSLDDYRRGARAYSLKSRNVTGNSFAVHLIFAAQDDRLESKFKI